MLRITGRRADGYHLLQSVFQFVGLCDELTFRPRRDSIIQRLGGLAGLPAEQDLAIRAARLLQAHTGCSRGVEIAIRKVIPVGGGLGGGSSDAATVLLVLNKIWNLNLSSKQLMSLGLSLGADVPVFLFGRSAWAEGIGEKLTALELDEPWYLIVQPEIQVRTAEIFAAPDLTRNSVPIRMSAFFGGAGQNDCYPVVARLHPEIGRLRQWLQGYAPASLSGTGACLFARFPDQDSALHVRSLLPEGCLGYVGRAINSHPLFDYFPPA